MIATEKFDIMIVQSENAQHPDVVEACAAAGIHVCVEKPMAVSLAAAQRMVRAAEAAGTDIVINWPLTWSPAARKAKELVDQGVIGRVLEVKWRAAHTGPLGPGAAHTGVDGTTVPMTGVERGASWWHQAAAGGGAMLDFCCYGGMYSRWVIGEQAQAAMGLKANLNSTWGTAEDNAVIVVRFPQAIALWEGAWTCFDSGVPGGPIVYGQTGTLVVETVAGKPRVRLERGHAQTTIYECEPLPAGRADVAQEYIHHLDTGEPLHQSLEMHFNLEIMAILDAGIRSAASGRLEAVNNWHSQIG
jgi:predicted dehydrogenase